MVKYALAIGALFAGLVAAGPAQAQQRTLIIFGSDKCPENTICVRAPETERYRIPEAMRNGPLPLAQQPWANRAKTVTSVGDTGTGSCSNVGQGGWTGCWLKQMKEAKAEQQQQQAAEAQSPLPK